MGAASSSTAGGVGGNPLLCLGGIDAGNNDAPAPSVKPSFLQVTAGKWAAPWKLVLSPEELAELPEDLRAATLSIRGKISRSNVAYPMPGTSRMEDIGEGGTHCCSSPSVVCHRISANKPAPL